ncbi:MAG: N-acetylglucosamine-6-phosphate deacetylase [Clostridia bacterium]|nr:N-acetylglucosamine-6-phosphate deacetylase [Clostridia bacterium]
MLLKNAQILNDQFEWMRGDIRITDGRISEIGLSLTDEPYTVDCTGLLAVPGLVDIHTHGAAGVDYSTADAEHMSKALQFEARRGVTTVLPTMMTMTPDMIERAMEQVRAYRANPLPDASYVPGVHLEGPFFSKTKCGAQPPEWIIPPDKALFTQWNRDGLVRLIAVAPEVPGALEFIKWVGQRTAVAVGHTGADYDTTRRAFEAGACDATHLYNGMTGATHRAPGVVGAVWDTPGVTAELICDGRHIHPAIVRSTFAMMGDRVALISDSLLITGQPEGAQALDVAGNRITIRDGRAELDNGTIAGSCTTLMECVRRAIAFGVRPELAFKAASLTPARTVGIDNKVGSLARGKRADILLLSPDYFVRRVFVGGRALR